MDQRAKEQADGQTEKWMGRLPDSRLTDAFDGSTFPLVI